MTLIPETGWISMAAASKDVMRAIVVRYHEHNKANGPVKVQFARWLPNGYAEWAWRPCWNPNGGEIYADGWMDPEDFQKACEALPDAAVSEYDL